MPITKTPTEGIEMKIAIFVLLLALSGCVSQSTMLANPDGKTTQCANWGFGLIGAPIAVAAQADCMKKAHAAGYSEVPR